MRRPLLALIAIIAAASIFATRKPHIFEFAAFYLGAKYFPEIGYAGLVDPLAAAFEELFGPDGLRQHAPRIRDFESGEMRAPEAVVAAFRRSAPRWTHARWRDFTADVLFLDRAMVRYSSRPPLQLWHELFEDYGNNYPPAWIAYVHPLTRGVPLNGTTLLLFCAVDVLLLAGVFCAVGAVWGLGAAVTALVFFASATDLLSYATWSLAKFDWLFAMALAILMTARGRHGVAGALWGTAAALRVFPGALAGIFAATWVIAGRKSPQLHRDVSRFAAGFIAAFALLNAVAGLVLSRWTGISALALWEGYAHRLGLYSGAEIVNRVGIGKLFELAGGRLPAWVGGTAAAVLALLLLFALGRRPFPPARLAALSLLFAPLLFQITHYYYLMLLLPLAAGERRLRWLTFWLLATNFAVIAAKLAGAPYASILQGECLSYSLALALVPLALFFLRRGDSVNMTPAGSAERGNNALP